MGKARKFLSVPRKKRRMNEALKKYLEEKRRNLQDKLDATLETGVIEPTSEPVDVLGRRIVNVADIFEQLKQLGSHGPLGCTINNMMFVREKRVGLKSCFTYKCNFCDHEQSVWSEIEKTGEMCVNTCAVSGTITTGGGHSQLEELLSTMNIPPMSDKTFIRYEEIVQKGLMDTASDEMKKAAEEEARHAVELGEVDENGTPLITVVADGSWCKRSYRTNYSSLSGVAAIVGYHTRKVLYMGVKNKYCTPCARAESHGLQPKGHSCYKNWGISQSSSSMEPSIIADGFACSEEMYGIKYARMIADGDSSVYNRVRTSRPYKNTTVEKVECRNHLLRNFCTKLRQIVTTSDRVRKSIFLRKKIGDSILRLRTAVTKAAHFRRKEAAPFQERVERLRLDIINIPSHVFGEHKQCSERGYFCKESFVESETILSKSNLVPDLVSAGLYQKVSEVVKDISRHSRSLLIDVTSNTVENYNSIIAKYIGGKRINFAQRGSYQGRCSAAVVQHNSGNIHYSLHKKMYNSSPGFFTKNTGMKRKRKVEKQQGNKKCKRSLFQTQDADYGPSAQRPDLDEEVMARETAEFLENLKKSPGKIKSIERDTIHQNDCGEWLEMRRSLLTASNFGRICKMKSTTSCENVVKSILYSTFDCEAMAYGRRNEDVARQQVSAALGKSIDVCGLFIDEEHCFLGASPDGLIGEDGIVEIKCPASAKHMTPEEAILERKVTFWKKVKCGEIGAINEHHNYFFQVQGQLHIAKKKYCQFVLWTPKGFKIERIDRDETFWNREMFEKLKRFYMNCLLPELVDPRHKRSMPIRNPSYVIEAQKKLKEAKELGH